MFKQLIIFVLAIACALAAPAPKPYVYASYAGAPLAYSGYTPYASSAYGVYPSVYSYSPYSLGYSGYGYDYAYPYSVL